MSTHIKEVVQAQKAEVAITDYLIVKPGTDADEVTLAVADDKPYGVAQVKQQLNQPGIGDVVEVAVYGGCYVKLGGSVSKGASIMPNNSSLGIAATSGKWAIGVADEDGVSGDIIAIRIFIHQLA
jgi:phage protein D